MQGQMARPTLQSIQFLSRKAYFASVDSLAKPKQVLAQHKPATHMHIHIHIHMHMLIRLLHSMLPVTQLVPFWRTCKCVETSNRRQWCIHTCHRHCIAFLGAWVLVLPHHQVDIFAMWRCLVIKHAVVVHGVRPASHPPQHGILLLHQVCKASILHADHMLHSNTLGWTRCFRRQPLLSPAQPKRANTCNAMKSDVALSRQAKS